LILDAKALSEPVAEFFGNNPRRDIGDAAGRERQNDAHSFVRIAGVRDGLMV
jgi:hypothetical protein